MSFISSLEKQLNTTTTDNGAKAYKATLDFNLDLFAKISASRENPDAIVSTYHLALQQDPETALRILFNSRDIRGGQGERKVFRHLLLNTPTEFRAKIIPLIPIYGRWDDLFILDGCIDWNLVVDFVKLRLKLDNDLLNENPSLLAKWMPSINASSKKTKQLGRQFAKSLGLSEKDYRLMLSNLRKKIDLVEQKMCKNKWSEINYSKVPSRAGLMYSKAFTKHDGERYKNFIQSTLVLEEKINTGTLYPYDIVEKTGLISRTLSNAELSSTEQLALDALWKNLPDYMEGKSFNGLVVADTSASMIGRPMCVSVSLALYIAERNSDVWKNKFITFSQYPQIQHIVGDNIYSKIKNLSKSEWGYNTDLMAVFLTILQAGKANKIEPKDMPEKIFIISDMQFNEACKSNKRTNFEQLQKSYAKYDYKMPELIFWNVNGNSNVPITVHDTGTAIISGCSPSILKAVLSGNQINPSDVMRQVIYAPRYDLVGEALKES